MLNDTVGYFAVACDETVLIFLAPFVTYNGHVKVGFFLSWVVIVIRIAAVVVVVVVVVIVVVIIGVVVVVVVFFRAA